MNENINKIMAVSKIFKDLKADDNVVIEALNQLSKESLLDIKEYLDSTSGEKINKIRSKVLEHLINFDEITDEVIEKIKIDVNEQYSTDILHSWKSYFSLLYIFFYFGERAEIKRELIGLFQAVVDDLKLTECSAMKVVGFDGAQYFGSDEAWIAIYNKKQPNQSSSFQLFINFSYPKISYGLFEYNNPEQYLTKRIVDIDSFNYEEMVSFLNQSRMQIIEDNNPVSVWKLSPGENAIHWDEMKKKGIASIGWGNYDFSGLTKSKIKKTNPEYFDKHDKSAGIISLIGQAKEGDIVYAFKGRKNIIGRGVVHEASKYSSEPVIEGTDFHNFLTVNWESNFIGHKLKKMVSMDAFANVSERRKELENHKDIDLKTKPENGEVKLSTNQILYGPPGTGKTYNTVDYALKIIKEDEYTDDRESNLQRYAEYLEAGQIVFTTFHQSYGYEDFVEGIKVKSQGDHLTYPIKPGIFMELCEAAEKYPAKNYVFIIDEINRGNISKIFGELITLIEPDKRKGADEEISVTLPYSKYVFSVPRNVHLLGTMNTADRSIAKLDVALRRRFDFIEMPPKPELLKGVKVDDINIEEMLTAINDRIELLYDRDHTIGHSFFMPLKESPKFELLANIFENNIIPLLQEYFFDDWKQIHWVLDGLKSKDKVGIWFVVPRKEPLDKLMGDRWMDDSGNQSQTAEIWQINPKRDSDGRHLVFSEAEAYLGIYLKTPQD